MSIRKRKRFKNMLSVEKRLEMKINEHKMLMNTLHEMFRKNNVSGKTLEMIKAEINETLKEIEELRKESAQESKASTVSMFDNIKKDNTCCDSPTCTCHHNYNLYGSIKKDDADNDNVVTNVSNRDVLLSSDFFVDLSDINVPSNMVKSVHFLDKGKIEVAINDFMVTVYGRRYPILSVIEGNIGRKFTMTIKHVNYNGSVVYNEKYVGCEITNYLRSSFERGHSEPSQIMLQINFDGVSYETAN